nr:DUF3050 domain-containing protein [Gammaproteobacteria bacterium]
MPQTITRDVIAEFRDRLESHPIYGAVASRGDLQCFMQHHVYSVWDFMSLIKYLQSAVAPSAFPWRGDGDATLQRFVNELVLEEESDEHPVNGGFASHFVLYQDAMREIGANTRPVRAFVDRVRTRGIDDALANADIPPPARTFTATTFGFIAAGRAHEAAAALALGREHIIPGMFRAILGRVGADADA